MKERRIKKLKQLIRDDFVVRNSGQIKIGDNYSFVPLMNHRCSYNSVHAVIAEKAVSVIECVVVDDDEITAHYINQLENGDYIDYTLGWSYGGSDYRLVRIVPRREWDDAQKVLSNLKANLCGDRINWFDKNILKITKWDLV